MIIRYIFISLIVVLFSVSACNTVQGIGRDIKKAGEGLEKVGR